VATLGYYEIELLEGDGLYPQFGFAVAAFARVLRASDESVGGDSWAVDGKNKYTKHKGKIGRYKCDQWKNGDVISLACDLDKMKVHVSLNGSFAAPHGVVFVLAPEAVGDGLFAAFSSSYSKVRYNIGEAPFRHAPPAADFQAYAAFEQTVGEEFEDEDAGEEGDSDQGEEDWETDRDWETMLIRRMKEQI